MKTFFTSEELAGHWVEQIYGTGRCPSNMSFHGPSFYSYGMEIGRIIYRKHRKAYLITTDGYSDTTSKHKNICRHAIPDGSIIFRVSRLNEMHPIKRRKDAHAVVAYSLAGVRRSKAKADRARQNKIYRLMDQLEWIEQAEAAIEYFELPAQDFKSIKAEVKSEIRAEQILIDKMEAQAAIQDEEEKTIAAVRSSFLSPYRASHRFL